MDRSREDIDSSRAVRGFADRAGGLYAGATDLAVPARAIEELYATIHEAS